MNLNNTLCKVCENDSNGNVTIETALITIGWGILAVLCIFSVLGLFAGYLYGMWYVIFGEFYQEMQEQKVVTFECALSIVCILLTLYIIIILIVSVYDTIKYTKLAKCPVKSNDKNKLE